MPKPDYAAILRTLVEYGVDFVVVGGVGAVLQGAPVTTFDIDVVHSTAEPNVTRLLSALDSLDACYRVQPERRLKPQASHLASSGHQLLITRYGPLDLLGSIGKGHTYSDLIPHTEPLNIAPNFPVPVLELAKLIEVKEETAGEKDRAVLPILRRTLQEKRRS
jgi:hypothetical protein